MIGTSQLINAFSRPCFTDTTDIFKDGSGVALYGLDYDASDTGGASGKFGEAAIFNGSSSKIDLPSNIVSSIISNSSFTVSAWFNTSVTGTRKMIFSSFDSTYIMLEVTTGNQLKGVVSNSAGTNTELTISTTVTDGNWHHALFTGENGNVKLYLDNGTPQTSASWNGTFFNGTTGTDIGSRFGNDYFNGSIDQVRIYDTALTSSQVTQLYQENSSTVGTHLFGCIANYNLDGNAKESMGTTAYDGTETDIKYRYDGTPTNVDFGVGGKSNYGARFNGNNSYINTGATLLGQTYTVSLWFNANTITSSSDGDTLYAQYDSADVGRHIVSIYNGNLRIFVGGQTVQTISTTWSTSTWTHLAVIKNSSGYEAFVNGSSIGTSSLTANIDVTENTMIGGDDGLATYSFDGDIDQVRIFSKALSSAEVGKLYGNGAGEIACEYTSTTDIVNYPAGTTPVAYYKLDNSSEDYSTGGNDGTDTNIEYRFGRFGQAAVFNGSSSKIVLPTSTFSPSTFTLSAWCNVTSDTDENTILELFDNQTYPNHTTIVFSAGSSGYSSRFLFRNYTTNQYNYNPSGTVEKNVWKHYAMTYDGSTVKSYIDGSLVDSGSLTLSNTVGTISSIQIGLSSGSRHLNGDIDQVRIYSSALSPSQVTKLYNEKPEVDTSNFKTVLYEGTGSGQYISNVGMDLETSGGLVWIKNRDTSGKWHSLADSVRGGGKRIFSNETSVQLTDTYDTQSFEANGFIIGNGDYVSRNNESHVAWVWKGGGEAVQNTQGTITSDVSANVDAGFSIATYTGVGYPNSATAEVGHGLSQAPDIVFIKGTGGTGQSGGAGSWVMGTGVLPTNNWVGGMYLNSNGAYYTAINYFWNGAATDSVVKLKTDWFVNGVNNTYVMYSWHSIPGYSKIGSYTGNGSSTGPIVYTTDDGTSSGSNGFEPRWVMIRRTDDTGNWYIVDSIRSTANPRNDRLLANTDNSEVSYTPGNIDFLSNGFQLKGTYNSTNALNGTYIYMAFK